MGKTRSPMMTYVVAGQEELMSSYRKIEALLKSIYGQTVQINNITSEAIMQEGKMIGKIYTAQLQFANGQRMLIKLNEKGEEIYRKRIHSYEEMRRKRQKMEEEEIRAEKRKQKELEKTQRQELARIKEVEKQALASARQKEAAIKRVAADERRLAGMQEQAMLLNRRFDITGSIENPGFQLDIGTLGKVAALQLFRRAVTETVFAIREGVVASIELITRINELKTISQEAFLSTTEWAQSLLQLSNAFGMDILDQTNAAYETLSNQIAKGAQVTLFLEEANKFALASVTSTTDAVNLLSSVMNSYNMSVAQAERVSAILFKTIELGRVRGSEMANTFGQVATIAAQLGVTLEEVAAATATITIRGVKFNESSTLMRNIMLKLIRPTEEMKEFYKEIGVTSGQAAIETYKFSGVLQLLEKRTKGSATEIGELFSRIRAITGIMMFQGYGLVDYAESLQKMKESAESYNTAVNIMLTSSAKTVEIQLTKIKNWFKELGNSFIQVIGSFRESADLVSNSVKLVSAAIIGGLIPAIAVVIVNAYKMIAAFVMLHATLGYVSLSLGAIVATMVALRIVYQHSIEKMTDAIRVWKEEQAKNILEVEKLYERGKQVIVDFVAEYVIQTNKILAQRNIDSRMLNAKYLADYEKQFGELENINNAFEQSISNSAETTKKAVEEIKNAYEELSAPTYGYDLEKEGSKLSLANMDTGAAAEKARGDYDTSYQNLLGATTATDFQEKLRLYNDAKENLLEANQRVIADQANAANNSNKQYQVQIRELNRQKTETAGRFGRNSAQYKKLVKEILALQREMEATRGISNTSLEVDNAKEELKIRQDIFDKDTKIHAQRLKLAAEEKKAFEEAQKTQQEQELTATEVKERYKRVQAFNMKDFIEITDRDELERAYQQQVDDINAILTKADAVNLTPEVIQSLQERKAYLILMEQETRDIINRNNRMQNIHEANEKIKLDRTVLENQKENLTNYQAEAEATLMTLGKYAKAMKIDSLGNYTSGPGQAATKGLTWDKAYKNIAMIERFRKAQIAYSEMIQKGIDDPEIIKVYTDSITKMYETFSKFSDPKVKDFVTVLGQMKDFLESSDKLTFLERAKVLTQIQNTLAETLTLEERLSAHHRTNDPEVITQGKKILEIQKSITETIRERARLMNLTATEREDRATAFATGGFIPRGTDTVAAMLSPGEFVMNQAAASRFMPQLTAMNNMYPGGIGYNRGGIVDVGGINVSVTESSNPQQTAQAVVSEINRGLRRGTLRLNVN